MDHPTTPAATPRTGAEYARLDHIYSLIERIEFGQVTYQCGRMGDGCYMQIIAMLDGSHQHGRKWYVSNYATDLEIVQTALKANLTFMEHEVRETFLFDGKAIFGPHLPLEALVASASGDLDVRQPHAALAG